MVKTRSGITAGLMLCATAALALPPYVADFKSTYGPKKGGALEKANCGVCHVGSSPKLNAYGIDMQKAMRKESTKKVTGSVLKKIEGLDSDKDGKKNIVEIRADKNPGDRKSK